MFKVVCDLLKACFVLQKQLCDTKISCRCHTACYNFGVDDEKDESGSTQGSSGPRKKVRKERVLHTRVPAVLDQELKRLATNLRVPVSNVVRAILEDAIDAVDSVGEKAQGELLGFVDRIARYKRKNGGST